VEYTRRFGRFQRQNDSVWAEKWMSGSPCRCVTARGSLGWRQRGGGAVLAHTPRAAPRPCTPRRTGGARRGVRRALNPARRGGEGEGESLVPPCYTRTLPPCYTRTRLCLTQRRGKCVCTRGLARAGDAAGFPECAAAGAVAAPSTQSGVSPGGGGPTRRRGSGSRRRRSKSGAWRLGVVASGTQHAGRHQRRGLTVCS